MKLFQKMSLNRARCLLCPRYCEISEGDIGKCHARINENGEIVPKDWGAISAMAVEPIEKKPFKHFLSGTKTLSVGGFGCNLECRYCENESISQSEPHINCKRFTPQDVIIAAKEKHCESVCMTYNEPTIAIEYLIRVGELCHNDGLKFIIKTNAYINEEPWEEICKVVDCMNIDYKGAFRHFEEITQCRFVTASRRIFAALDNDVHVEISIPVFPNIDMNGYFFPLEMVAANNDVPCHLLKVNPAHLMINERTTYNDEIEIVREKLSHIFSKVYV